MQSAPAGSNVVAEAEAAVVASMMLDPAAAAAVMGVLEVRDFANAKLAELFVTLAGMAAEGAAIDTVTVAQRLQASGSLERHGGIPGLVSLLESCPSAANAEWYAGIVREAAQKRRTLDRLSAATYRLQHDEIGAAEAIGGLLEDAASDARQGVLTAGSSLYAELLDVVYGNAPPAAPRVPTGIAAFDAENVGVPKDGLVVVAGRPSSGKTSLALQVTLHAARATGKGALIFSMEMNRRSLMQIAVGNLAGVNTNHLRRNELTEDERLRIGSVAQHVSDANLLITDSRSMTPARMFAIAKMRRMKGEIGVIMVDYLQLIDGSEGVNKRSSTRQEEVAYISRYLKMIAGEMGCPVIALSQLNRPQKGAEQKRPQMSDLRESGQIEQDADCVMFVHRPEQFVTDPVEKAACSGEAEIIVGKFREGVVATYNCRFEHAFQRFTTDSYEAPNGDVSGFE